MFSAQQSGLPEDNRTWFLIAHRSGARLFSSDGAMKNFRLLQEFPHPDGRLKPREIDADKYGGKFNSSVGNSQVHATSREVDSVSHVSDRYAKNLCSVLQKGRAGEEYQKLVLIAEPKFLGRLRECLDEETATRITRAIDKNWMELPPNELRTRLAAALLP